MIIKGNFAITDLNESLIQQHLTGIKPLTGSNFFSWTLELEIVLGCLDYDFVLTEEKPPTPTKESTETQRATHAKWVKANKLAILIIRASIDETIRGGIPSKETVKELLEIIKAQFQGSIRARQYSNLLKLTSLKHKGDENVRQHNLKISKIVITLRELGLTIEDDLMVHLVMASLPMTFDTFKVNYSSQERKWDLNELIAICVYEEDTIKKGKTEMANLAVST